MSKSYIELLKDPRWQKKRLQILERDNWTCQDCYDTTTTLNVHHLHYGEAPWDVPDGLLITLCEPCHELTTSLMNQVKGYLQTLNQEELHVLLAFIRSRRLLVGFHPDFQIKTPPEADGVGAAIGGLPWRTVAAACKGGVPVSRELIQRLQREAGLPVATGGD